MEATLGVSELLELIQIALAISALAAASAVFFAGQYAKAKKAGDSLVLSLTGVGFFASVSAAVLSLMANREYLGDLYELLMIEQREFSIFLLTAHGWLVIAVSLLGVSVFFWSFVLVMRGRKER